MRLFLNRLLLRRHQLLYMRHRHYTHHTHIYTHVDAAMLLRDDPVADDPGFSTILPTIACLGSE